MRGRPAVFVLSALLLASSFAAQQQPSHQMPAITVDALTRPIPTREHIGMAGDRYATLPPKAQRDYEQGLALLHNYVWLDAARSFHQVLRESPGNPLATVGLSYAYEALSMRSKAVALIADASARPIDDAHARWHVKLRNLELRAETVAASGPAVRAYRAELDRALREFPDDEELWLLRGMAEASVPGDRGQGSTVESIRYYRRAAQIAPDHFAAHHYLAHALENSGDITQALEEGGRYAQLSASVPHAHHMYGHDLRRVGRIRDAIAEFETADRLGRAYAASEHLAPGSDWHYEHNLDLLGTSYLYLGQVRRASELLRSAFDLPSANLVQIVNKRQWPLMLRLLGRHDEAMQAATVLAEHPHPVAEAIGHLERAQVDMTRNQLEAAARESNLAAAALNRGGAGSALANIPMRLVRGELLLRRGERSRGEPLLLSAIADARAARGPDEWVQALFEMEWVATVARDTESWPLASHVAAQMLDHDPAYGGSHFAAGLAARQRGDADLAAKEFAEARRLWSNADPDFPPLKRLNR